MKIDLDSSPNTCICWPTGHVEQVLRFANVLLLQQGMLVMSQFAVAFLPQQGISVTCTDCSGPPAQASHVQPSKWALSRLPSAELPTGPCWLSEVQACNASSTVSGLDAAGAPSPRGELKNIGEGACMSQTSYCRCLVSILLLLWPWIFIMAGRRHAFPAPKHLHLSASGLGPGSPTCLHGRQLARLPSAGL